MSLFGNFGSLVQTLFTANNELIHQRDLIRTLGAEIKAIDASLNDIRERVVRLEAQQDAAKAERAADLSALKFEVERAVTQLTRLLPKPPDGKEQP